MMKSTSLFSRLGYALLMVGDERSARAADQLMASFRPEG